MADKRAKMVEIETGLLDQFEAKCKANGTTFRFELEDAMRRHLTYPPRREPEPLPDAAPAVEPPAKKKGRGK
jgi:hypothetical protein